MAKKKHSSGISLQQVSGDWKVSPDPTALAAAANDNDILSLAIRSGEFVAEGSARAEASARRGVSDQTLVLEAEAKPGEAYVLAVRHASGALKFELPTTAPAPARRGTRSGGKTKLRFRITPGVGSADRGPRRSIFGDIVQAVLLRVVKPVVDAAVGALAHLWEKGAWGSSKSKRGFVHLDAAGLKAGSLRPIAGPQVFGSQPQRNLLLIHGTFSCAEAFGELATTRGTSGQTFLDFAREIYQDRIFAFNHFTVSETPEDNARAILAALPKTGALFDVVTHSRGGLVLRTLVEEGGKLGEAAERFKLGQAILVAAPNGGTPLAQTGRFHTLLNWLANLLEVFPQNPFTFGGSLVLEALKWVASAVGESIPGLAAMNPDGEVIASLQGRPHPLAAQYAALVANYRANGSVLARMADLGLDALFAGANDMVVPTEGGWRIADDDAITVSTGRIGCFGPGGNLDADGVPVSHTNFFALPETIDFLAKALRGEASLAPPLDPQKRLPTLLRRRGGGMQAAFDEERETSQTTLSSGVATHVATANVPLPVGSMPETAVVVDSIPLDEMLQLLVIARDFSSDGEQGDDSGDKQARKDHQGSQVIATFRNAKVVEPFRVSGGEDGQRWRRLISMNKRIENSTLGVAGAKFPDRTELVAFGDDLFQSLFPGQIRRLYDEARTAVGRRRLSVVLTTVWPWMAAMPWEFSYDRLRQTFVCMEDINFLRNILTAVPADSIPPRGGKLRILVVAAQPIGLLPLSVAEEAAVIRRAFESLEKAGLAEVTVLPQATISLMHRFLEQSADSGRYFDVLHFIGHGEYDHEHEVGCLLFEDDRGGVQPLNADALRQIVRQRGIRLVFLNACETGRGDLGPLRVRYGLKESRSAPALSYAYVGGIAPALVQGGVPAVVANQYSVLDPAAAAFAEHFYWSLAHGRSVGDAAREARISVNYSFTGEAIDWAVPVLFARNPGERLVGKPSASIVSPGVDFHGNLPHRRRGERRRLRIGVWDVNYVLPELEAVLASLNAVQSQYQFEVIVAPAPLGTWRRVPDGEGGTILEGDQVIERLKGLSAAWGVDGVLCVTGFRLKGLDDDGESEITDLYLYGDLEKDRKANVSGIAVVSVSAFKDQFESPGFSPGRFVANMLATMLNDADMHLENRGPKDCPNFYNEDLEQESVFGKLAFCNKCRKSIGVDLDPLNKLLQAF